MNSGWDDGIWRVAFTSVLAFQVSITFVFNNKRFWQARDNNGSILQILNTGNNSQQNVHRWVLFQNFANAKNADLEFI